MGCLIYLEVVTPTVTLIHNGKVQNSRDKNMNQNYIYAHRDDNPNFNPYQNSHNLNISCMKIRNKYIYF